MREVAGEHDEVRRFRQRINGSDRLCQRSFGVGIGWPFKAPVRVGQLDEIELLGIGLRRGAARGTAGQAKAGGKYRAPEARKLEEFSAIDWSLQGSSLAGESRLGRAHNGPAPRYYRPMPDAIPGQGK